MTTPSFISLTLPTERSALPKIAYLEVFKASNSNKNGGNDGESDGEAHEAHEGANIEQVEIRNILLGEI